MSTILAITEKPSVAKTLAAWLAKTYGFTARSCGSYIQVGHYQVGWLYGHMLENYEPHDYDPMYRKWSVTHLPFFPGEWKLKVREEVDKKTGKKTGKPDPGTLAQINALKVLMKDATEIIGAGDPDQEGQLLQDEFLIWAGNRAPVKRLWLAATDDASVAKAWAAMKPNSEYAGYFWSALSRSQGDFASGINLSRACTLASQANGGNAVLPVGRVQTPTLALIVELEKRIRHFKPVDYYTPFIALATSPAFKASWSPDKEKDARLDPEGRLLDKKVTQAIVDACKKAGKATVTSVKATKGKEGPKLPFSLSTLQEHMSKRFGMGVQDVLKFAQALYEKKIATYPRTDCEYLPESQHEEAADIFKGLRAGIKELGAAPGKADLSIKSRAYNDKNVTAHHAIVPRPTTLAQLADLSAQERLVWIEVAKRYLLQFFPAAEFLKSEIELLCAGEQFFVSGKVFTSRGWKDAFAAEGDEGEEEKGSGKTLPKVEKGDVLTLADAGFDSTTTKAPERFTEGTLIAAMKAVHKYVSDARLKAILRENIGIGTEATRANIIGELFGRKFIELNKKKDIVPTDLGEQFIDALPRQITAPDMTAMWQQAMDDIKKTKEAGYKAFMAAQQKWLTDIVNEVPGWFLGKALIRKDLKSTVKVKETEHTCLKCSSALKHIEGKFGWFFGCQNDACKAVFKDVEGKPVEKVAAPTGKVTIAGIDSGSKCTKCKKGEMQVRVCGPASKTPGKQFLSCSNFFAKTAKTKCDHSVWPT